ncbi:MAG: ABC transporter transmembrane domain-containing protein, partial [Thermoanaerobaculia bacterium]
MNISRFLWQHLRPYAGWGVIAFAAILVFALSTAVLASLIEPIFGEVLMSDEGVPSFLGGGGGGGEEGREGFDLPEGLSFLDLKGQLDRAYEAVKSSFGVEGDEVVYFVPLLFLAIFLFRSVAHFLSGYTFQRVGLGVTTDIRNELYDRILHQSSRFHADHPSGELVSRVINDVALMQNAVS